MGRIQRIRSSLSIAILSFAKGRRARSEDVREPVSHVEGDDHGPDYYFAFANFLFAITNSGALLFIGMEKSNQSGGEDFPQHDRVKVFSLATGCQKRLISYLLGLFGLIRK